MLGVLAGALANQGIIILTNAGDTATIGRSVTNDTYFGLWGDGSKATIGSLTNNATVNVEHGSTLQINGDLTNSGDLLSINVSGGANSINIIGAVANSGNFSLNHPGDLASLGSLNNSGLLVLYGGDNMLQVNGDVTNSFYLEVGGLGGGDRVNIAGSLTNLNNGYFAVYGADDKVNIGGITNYGFVGLMGAGTMGTTVSLSNRGTVDVERGSTLQVNGDVTNAGTLETDVTKSGGGNILNVTGPD